MSNELEASYDHCRRLARRAASSFYYSFLLLPRAKRRSMYALYAFLRHTDDLGDSDEPADMRRRCLRRWRGSLSRALSNQFDDPLLPALADTVHRYGIPEQYLFDVLDGMEMDLTPCRFESFEELQQYCYRVASVVGLSCIHIWGFHGDEAFEPARRCGLAFQLTNILRDLKEDARRDRIYLPLADLRRFNYGPADLKRGVCNARFQTLMRFQIERAEQLYRQALPLEDYLERDGRRVFRAMVTTYHSLLGEIKRRQGDVFSRRVRLGTWKKLRISLTCFWLSSGE